VQQVRFAENHGRERSQAFLPAGRAASNPQQEFWQVDTTNILFVLRRRIRGLDKIISRARWNVDGFGANVRSPTSATSGLILREVEPRTAQHSVSFRNSSVRLPISRRLEDLDERR